MKIRTVLLLFLVCVVVVGVFVWFQRETSRDAITIDVVVDRTGPIALYGTWAENGMTMAVDEMNSKGGYNGRKIRLEIEDAQSSTQIGVNAFQRFITLNHPGTIIVATNTSTIMACAPISNEKQVVLFTPIASGANVTNAGDFVFRNRVSGYYEASEMALFASESFKVKSMALVVINNDAGSGYIEAFGTVFKSKGGKISENVFLDPGKVDFRTQVLKVRASKPEGVFLASTVKEAAIFIKQSKEVGFVPKWFSMTTIQSDELFKIAGSSAEGLVFVAEGGDDSDITYKTFATQYEKRFGASPTMNALNGYDAINLLVPLVAQYGGEGQKIRDGLYQTKSYKGVGGVLSFDQNGDAKKPLKLMMAKNGRFVRFE